VPQVNPLTPPDESVQLPDQAQEAIVAPVPTPLELQDVPIPWNTHPGAIKDTIFIQMVLSMDSSSTSIHHLLSS